MTTTTIDVYSFLVGSWDARVAESENGQNYETIWEGHAFPDPYTAFREAALALSFARPNLAVSPTWPRFKVKPMA